MKKIIITSLLALISLSFIAGCASNPTHSRDRLEPLNRVTHKFNDKADQWVLKPVAEGYQDYTPHFIRTGVDNFFSNLDDANSGINYALQGNGKASLYSLSRFLLNSTAGLFGLFDLTSEEERPYEQTGFGDTFASWGWKNSNYLVIPLLGPSTIRDGTGTVGNTSFRHQLLYGDPHSDAKLASSALDGINTRAKLIGVEDTISDAALDPYAYTRDAWLEIRAKQTGDDLPQTEEDDFSIDDLVN